MNAHRPARPVLATLICIYEAAVLVLALALRLRPGQAPQVHAHAAVLPPISPLVVPLSWLGYTLALAAAIALWQMRRSAFFLLMARLAISIAVVLLTMPRLRWLHHRIDPLVARAPGFQPDVLGLAILTIVVSWSISIAILCYVGVITSPRRPPPPDAETQAAWRRVRHKGRPIF